MNDKPSPTGCPRCRALTTRVVWNARSYISERDLIELATGRVLLGGDWPGTAPLSVCVSCRPEWAEVHRLATQDLEWQKAKQRAIEAQDFYEARRLRDLQYEIRHPLVKLLESLVKGQIESKVPPHQA